MRQVARLENLEAVIYLAGVDNLVGVLCRGFELQKQTDLLNPAGDRQAHPTLYRYQRFRN